MGDELSGFPLDLEAHLFQVVAFFLHLCESALDGLVLVLLRVLSVRREWRWGTWSPALFYNFSQFPTDLSA